MDTTNTTGTTTQDRNVQDEIKDSVHRIWLAGLGALAAAEEEGSKLFSRLVDRGRDVEAKGKVEVDKLKTEAEKVRAKAESTFESWGGRFDETLTSALHRLGVPTRDEIRTLTQRVEELNAKVEALKPRVTPATTGPEVVTPETATTPTDPSKIIV
ncbi:MAG TPA: phasin family protein [Thermoanaerobaculia bacterium]|nr:phasin family protein [Thermoanaerobaculia bacterium]